MKKYKIIVILICLFTTYLMSCSKMDEYKSTYMKNGSITYAGKMDSIQILSGKYRVRLTGLFTSDPNIVRYKVFWNSRQDSLEVPITRSDGIDTANVIISNLEEGAQSFEIRTYDNQGNSSVPSYVTASVYGDLYQSSLVNRGIVEASMQDDGSALITWADVNTDAGVVKMNIQYTQENGNSLDTTIAEVTTDQSTSLPHIKTGNSINYRTAYIPTSTAIDTFWVDFETHSVKADVTSLYLSNVGPNFTGILGSDGRFGTLGAPWITNVGAKNKASATSNAYGGYQHASWQANGVITWETWNNTPVVDGKIYQVTSSELPVGSYTIVINYYSEIQQNSTVYCVATEGNGEIPSLANLSSSLGYTSIFNGAIVGTTAPNVTESKSFDFTLTTSQYVSLGFLGNIVGSATGSYFEIRSINLIKN